MHYKNPVNEALEAACETCERLKKLSKELIDKEIQSLVDKGFNQLYLNHGYILIDPEANIPFDISLNADWKDAVIIGNFLGMVDHTKFVIFLYH